MAYEIYDTLLVLIYKILCINQIQRDSRSIYFHFLFYESRVEEPRATSTMNMHFRINDQ